MQSATARDQTVHVYRLFLVCFHILHDDNDRGFEFRQGPVHDLVNFRDLLRDKGRGQ